MKTICVILAGGKSRRMGRDKAMLPLGNQTFLSRLISKYSIRFSVYVSVGTAGKFPCPGAEELVDLRPGAGPLAGLEAAFSQTDADAVFLTATDLPCGSVELANHLLKELGEADACVICRRDGKPEPTFGVYRRNCQKAVKMLLDEDQRTFRTLFDRIHVRWLYEKELAEFPLEQLLQNINTPEEYEKLQRFCQNDQ